PIQRLPKGLHSLSSRVRESAREPGREAWEPPCRVRLQAAAPVSSVTVPLSYCCRPLFVAATQDTRPLSLRKCCRRLKSRTTSRLDKRTQQSRNLLLKVAGCPIQGAIVRTRIRPIAIAAAVR